MNEQPSNPCPCRAGGCCGSFACGEGTACGCTDVSGVCPGGRGSALDDLINLAKERGDWTLPILLSYKTTAKSHQPAIETTTGSSKCCEKNNGSTLSARLKSWVKGLFAWLSGAGNDRKRKSTYPG
jgi:hypothetical protein